MKFMFGFLIGLMTGAFLTSILMPQSGSETRHFLAEQARQKAELARRRAEEARKRLQNQGHEWLEEARASSDRGPWEQA